MWANPRAVVTALAHVRDCAVAAISPFPCAAHVGTGVHHVPTCWLCTVATPRGEAQAMADGNSDSEGSVEFEDVAVKTIAALVNDDESDDEPIATSPLPVFFLSHGAGPCIFLRAAIDAPQLQGCDKVCTCFAHTMVCMDALIVACIRRIRRTPRTCGEFPAESTRYPSASSSCLRTGKRTRSRSPRTINTV